MLIAIVIIAILGNLYLFSGYDVEGGVTTFMVGIAVLADIFIIWSAIRGISEKIKESKDAELRAQQAKINEENRIRLEKIEAEKKAQQEKTKAEIRAREEKLEEEKRIKQAKIDEENRVRLEKIEVEKKAQQERIKAEIEAREAKLEEEKRIKQEKIDEENRKIKELEDAINRRKDRFRSFEIIPNFQSSCGEQLQVKTEWLNREVIVAVKAYKEKISGITEEIKKIDLKINKILQYENVELQKQLEYLDSQHDKLSELKNKREKLCNEINSTRIKLLNDDVTLHYLVLNTFDLVKKSQKCRSSKMKMSDFLIVKCTKLPKELSLFIYNNTPAMVKFGGFSYCFFSNVILVFDENGIFSTAIDPSAVSVLIKLKNENVMVSNNRENFNNKFVGSDSKKVKTGETQTRWLYSCLDGTPDLRYRNNTRLESRTDVYEYAEVSFILNDSSIEFCLSSKEAIKSLKQMSNEYCKKQNHLHNPTMDLLDLFREVIGDNDESVNKMIEILSNTQSSNSYFCSLVQQENE